MISWWRPCRRLIEPLLQRTWLRGASSNEASRCQQENVEVRHGFFHTARTGKCHNFVGILWYGDIKYLIQSVYLHVLYVRHVTYIPNILTTYSMYSVYNMWEFPRPLKVPRRRMEYIIIHIDLDGRSKRILGHNDFETPQIISNPLLFSYKRLSIPVCDFNTPNGHNVETYPCPWLKSWDAPNPSAKWQRKVVTGIFVLKMILPQEW